MRVFLIPILVLFSTALVNECDGQMTKTQKEAIQKGLDSGKALADALKDGKFRDSLVKLGKNLSPYLGALGPLAGIALAFIPTADSPELIFMREKFKQINQKLDFITAKFDQITKMISWQGTTLHYGVYERKIRTAESNLNRVFLYTGKARESAKNYFLTAYQNDFGDSLSKLYSGAMDHFQFAPNIFDEVVKKTSNHKGDFEQFSLGLIQLLVVGIKIRISYHGLRNEQAFASHLTTEWNNKMLSLRYRIEQKVHEIKGRYASQLKIDAENWIRSYHSQQIRDLIHTLYNLLIQKYDWRYWFVSVYQDTWSYDRHTISACGGYIGLHKFGKNFIISSQDMAFANRFHLPSAAGVLQGVVNDINGCHARDPGDRARDLVNRMRGKGGQSCVPYALVMAVEVNKGMWYISWGTHRAARQIVTRKRCCWGNWWTRRCKTVSWRYDMIIFG